jgi:hypothetical protein
MLVNIPGGKKMTDRFKWDDKALIPDSVEVTLPAEVTGSEKVKVKFYELSRPDLVGFVAEAIDKKFVNVNDETGDISRTPFKDVEAEQSKLLFKYLAIATKNVHSAEFFENLALTSGGLYALVSMLLTVNHLDEILATGGNWLLLPSVRTMLTEEAEKTESDESLIHQPTTEA